MLGAFSIPAGQQRLQQTKRERQQGTMAMGARGMGRSSKLTPQLQKRLVTLLSKGATDKDACELVGITTTSFYRWLEVAEAIESDKPHQYKPDTEADQQKFLDFSDAVTRARAKANKFAIEAFRTGLQMSQIVDEIEEELTETRLTKKGEPYEYTRKSTRKVVRHMPPDWRAGEAWLKRRDKSNWSERMEQTGADGEAITIRFVDDGTDD